MYATGSRLALKALVLGLGDPLAAPSEAPAQDEALLRPLRLVLEDADVTGYVPRKLWEPVKTTVTALSEVADSSFVIAELSRPDPGVAFYLGLAHSLGKTILALKRFDSKAADRVFGLADFRLEYDDSYAGIEDLIKRFRSSIDTIRRNIQLDHSVLLGRENSGEAAIDWAHLPAERFGDLCYELLLREGYGQLEWTGGGELDLLGFRPQADGPRELFFFSLGGGLASAGTAEALTQDFQRLLPRVQAERQRAPMATTEGRLDVNLYFLWSPGDTGFAIDKDVLQELAQRLGVAARNQQTPIKLRASWLERRRLEALIARHPMLVRKYFSADFADEGFSPALAAPGADGDAGRRRKSLEELYREAVLLAEKAAEASGNLEKKYGINPGLEWQERAYSVTHSIGNAIFPVETYLDMIREIFGELGNGEGQGMAELALESLEKAKVHIRKFKNIARLKAPQLERVEVLPRLEASLNSARAKRIQVDWYVGDHAGVDADPDLFDELVDELVANSVSWLDRSSEKRIVVTLRTALPDDLSPYLQRQRASGRAGDNYVWIRFEDSGPGVPGELKEKIFELFYSTNPSGMGFGLAIVRKNLRDFGGDIIETGMPGQGARFDLFLPFSRST